MIPLPATKQGHLLSKSLNPSQKIPKTPMSNTCSTSLHLGTPRFRLGKPWAQHSASCCACASAPHHQSTLHPRSSDPPLSHFFCAVMTAQKIMAQPISSRTERTSWRKIHPPRTAKTDSRLISNVAVTGCRYFCATICKVKAIALAQIPQKSQYGAVAAIFSAIHGSPATPEAIAERIVATTNCNADNLTQSHFAA